MNNAAGVAAEQKTVVGDQYKVKLVVMNIGDTYTTGSKETAFVINDLIKPASVIASHANEPATEGGKVRAGTRSETFITATKVPVHVRLGGKTMPFECAGMCTAGC